MNWLEEFISKVKTETNFIIKNKFDVQFLIVVCPVNAGAKAVYFCEYKNNLPDKTLEKLAIIDFAGEIHLFESALVILMESRYSSWKPSKDPEFILLEGVHLYSTGVFYKNFKERIEKKVDLVDPVDLTEKQEEDAHDYAQSIAAGESDVFRRFRPQLKDGDYERYLYGYITCEDLAEEYFKENKDTLISNKLVKDRAMSLVSEYATKPVFELANSIHEMNINVDTLTVVLNRNGKEIKTRVKTLGFRCSLHDAYEDDTALIMQGSYVFVSDTERKRVYKELGGHEIYMSDISEVLSRKKVLYKRFI